MRLRDTFGRTVTASTVLAWNQVAGASFATASKSNAHKIIPGVTMIDVPDAECPPPSWPSPDLFRGSDPAIPTGSVAACDCIFRNAGGRGDSRVKPGYDGRGVRQSFRRLILYQVLPLLRSRMPHGRARGRRDHGLKTVTRRNGTPTCRSQSIRSLFGVALRRGRIRTDPLGAVARLRCARSGALARPES